MSRRYLPLMLAALMMFAAPHAQAASVSNINKSPSNSNINKKNEPAPAPPAAKTAPKPEFAKVIDDLPLMPGLTVLEDKDVLFIAGPGRIAQTTATGRIDIDEVYNYYERTLPQLGWKKINARTYERDNERLRLDVSGVNPAATTIVRFSLEPLASK